MTATSLPVKMAACLPQDGDTTDEDKIARCLTSHTPKHPVGGTQGEAGSLSATSIQINFEGDKAYDEVAKYDEEDLRNLLEEVTNVGKKSKNNISPYALALIRKERDALREESSSDDGELALRHRNKKLIGHRDQQSTSDQSAAARASTGGSLGSLHDSGEPKPKEGHNQGVASRSREGGSCGNLSRGSFETQPPRKRKGRKSRDAARASTSQREGGSLQNLSKTEAASNHPKSLLHKSGSLSQVCSEVTGARNKNRRQKTSSESSSSRYQRRSEDREGAAESSGDENPCHRLLPSQSTLSTHSAEHPFPPEGVGGATSIVNEWNNDLDDSQSQDGTEGETTEEENENKEYSRGLGLSLGRNCSNEPIEEDGIELQEVTVHRTTTDVDRGINFNLGRCQEDNMHGSCSRRTLAHLDSHCINSILKEEKPSNKGADQDEVIGKRKHSTNRTDNANSENKSSLDVNGNPIMGTSSSSSCPSSAIAERPTVRRNGLSGPHKEISRFDRLKAKSDKKKASKEKGVVNIEKTPGFCGDQDLQCILKFLGAENETTTKSRKKHKNREDEKVKKRSKNSDREEEKPKSEPASSKLSIDVALSSNANNRRSKEREDERKSNNNKKNKNENGKKKKGGNLRESSSVEDLVSKSKQSDNVRDIRKQVTVDDGDMEFDILHTYHNSSKKVDQLNNLIIDGKYLKDSDPVVDNENPANNVSDFVADFYSVGDSILAGDLSRAPSSPSGDFEIVSSKKRSKKFRSGSQTASQSSKSGGSDRWSAGSNSGSVYGEDSVRGSRFSSSKLTGRPGGVRHEKPQINFLEGPRTAHENSFLARWSQYGVGERHGGDRYGATTSAPHSEDSDSDGDDSVHSMPVPSITPRPDVRKPPPSSGSTPQASYANIAKLAATANHAQMKRLSASSGSQSATGPVKETEKNSKIDSELTDSKSSANESRPTNILDDNFPSLTESLGASSPPSAIFTSNKTSESRTNPLGESSVIPPKVVDVQFHQVLDKPKEVMNTSSVVCDGKTISSRESEADIVSTNVPSQEDTGKCASVIPASTSPPPSVISPLPKVSSPQPQQHQVRYQSCQPHAHSHPPPPPPPSAQQHPQPGHHPYAHNQNPKPNHPQNTQSNSYRNTPPMYYQNQRINPFNRKDDDSPPDTRYPPPPLRSPNGNNNNSNVSPNYPPLNVKHTTLYQQPPPSTIQRNSQSHHQNPHVQRNPHTVQNNHVQEKPPPTQPPPMNLNAQQYPPLQSPYSLQNSPLPKGPPPPHGQGSTHNTQRNQQTHSQSNCNPKVDNNENRFHSSSHVKNSPPQQNHHNHHHSQLNSNGPPNELLEQKSCTHKSPSPIENSNAQQTPCTRKMLNSDQNSSCQPSSQLSVHVQVIPSELDRFNQSDQQSSLPAKSSTAGSFPSQSSTLPPQSSVKDTSTKAGDHSIVNHHPTPPPPCTNNLPRGEANADRHSAEKSQSKFSDTSRLKKVEPAVVFTDNAKFDHSVSGLEFGFGFDEPIVTSGSVSECDTIVNDTKKTASAVTKDFSKWFQAPKNEVFNYNYEELTRHLSNEWDKTMQLMEGDPKNVQYWRASSSMEA